MTNLSHFPVHHIWTKKTNKEHRPWHQHKHLITRTKLKYSSLTIKPIFHSILGEGESLPCQRSSLCSRALHWETKSSTLVLGTEVIKLLLQYLQRTTHVMTKNKFSWTEPITVSKNHEQLILIPISSCLIIVL